MSLKLAIPPLLEPVTLSELKLQCGFGPMEDTDLLREQTLAEPLRAAIAAAREDCEGLCARAFLTQTWTLTLDRFPRADYAYFVDDPHDIVLPLPTFQAITAFTYKDASGATVDNTAQGAWGYQLVSGGDRQCARLRPPVYRGWPMTGCDTAGAVSIGYTCGFADTPQGLPFAIREAVKLDAHWFYEGAKGHRPEGVMALLNPYIIAI